MFIISGLLLYNFSHGLSSRSGRQIGDATAGEAMLQVDGSGAVVPFIVPVGSTGDLPGLVGIAGNGTAGNSTSGKSGPSNGGDSNIIVVKATNGTSAYSRELRGEAEVDAYQKAAQRYIRKSRKLRRRTAGKAV